MGNFTLELIVTEQYLLNQLERNPKINKILELVQVQEKTHKKVSLIH